MIARNFSCQHGARRDEHSAFILSSLSPDCARFAPFFLFLSSPLCGEGSARSLQDNSKIRNSLFLLMSGGRSWYPV
ncbi:hypothetical protein A670_01954 [Salmonella enterica subsp. enterica serovar Dublin str. UC16]|uniref:Uncharacterized protein n=1 Tax=Salmonella enterica subsp. enterica serovar Dublin str. UC16 TaxID=1192688 RepID=M7RMF8_SALDU|nr:hypothetical protein A670_01954 [Salmonella enterica subsp. enterica serovar Dublin str. UC16]